MAEGKRFLIVRTDRVGDVLLTTPLGSALRKHYPDSRIDWLVTPYTAPLLEENPEVGKLLLDRGQSVRRLAEEVRGQAYDAALIAYPRWRTVCALWRAGVPRRIGPANKWYSLFLTNRIWQHRSESLKHEADYNLELLQGLGLSAQRTTTRFVLKEAEREAARRTLSGYRISGEKPLVMLHPGSGGSAARWPLSHFMALGDRLQEQGAQVVVTSGPGESYQQIMIDQMRRIPVFIPAGSVRLRELGALFACADLVVSNSTGPLHLAVALGVRTVSVYSPLAACHPRRWGPYPAYPEGTPDQQVVLAPENQSGQALMAAVSVDEVFLRCQRQLERAASKRTPDGSVRDVV